MLFNHLSLFALLTFSLYLNGCSGIKPVSEILSLYTSPNDEENSDAILILNFIFEVPVGFEPTNKGFADLPLKPLGYSTNLVNYLKLYCKKEIPFAIGIGGAGNGTRTRDINLGKVALYQLSYSRISKP